MPTTSTNTSARFSKFTAVVSLCSLLAICGCSSIEVKLGTRVSLDKIPVASMEASLPDGPAIAPGEKAPLVVTLVDTTGKILVTEGKGKGKVLWKDLTVTTTVVSVNKKGILSLPHDPRVSDGKTGHVTVTAASHPGIHSDLDIPLRYDYKFQANYSGADGSSGFNGTDGTAGLSGTAGSIDPNNPSPGGNGSNGGDGSNGQDGGDGGNAPPVTVVVTLRAGAHPLLQASVSAPGRKEHFYLVDPQGGSLTVIANGGAGGSGGRGGKGGAGGSGGIGTPNGTNGSSGSDGRNGNDGSPGRAGTITVTYDPQVKPYLAALHLVNQGGPAPVFKEQPVAPLW